MTDGAESSTRACVACKVVKPLGDFGRNARWPDGLSRQCRECGRASARASYWKRIGREPAVETAPAGSKRCRKCDAVKPVEAFPPDRKLRDGRGSWCRACKGAASADWRERNRQHTRDYARDYAAAHPDEMREKDRRRALRYPGRTTAQARRWRQANAERAAAFSAAWKRANREKVNAAERRRYQLDRTRALAWIHQRRAKIMAGPGVTAADMARIRAAQRDRCAICRKPLRGGGHQDHIVPIARGGLHTPRNIQLACGRCNQRKGSKDPLVFMRRIGRLL